MVKFTMARQHSRDLCLTILPH
ncbi:hypothetical protein RJ641_013019 [Dillenia turbinata]|uniref:Uncharacterized protein n=1 Tax=Dillenia turbinata TaxID=194707 RepID=A0AAN8W522_9MAGN